jgi:RecB family exonuclease
MAQMKNQIHSKFSPSTSGRWTICPGSIQHQKQDWNPNAYAAEGTRMHSVSEECLLNPDKDPLDFIGTTAVVDGFDIKFTDELEEAVRFYVDSVLMMKDTFPEADFSVEAKVSYTLAGIEIFGTVDALFDIPFDQLIVMDLKGGKGVSVPATSSQLKLYAVLAAGDRLLTYEKITTIVVQPRDRSGERYKIAEWTAKELFDWVTETVIPAIKSANSDDPIYKASIEGCRWCHYAGDCRHQAELALNIALNEYDGEIMSVNKLEGKDPHKLSDAEIGSLMEALPFLNEWIAGINFAVLQRLKAGATIPGYKLVQGKTNRTWGQDEKETEKILRSVFKMKVKDIFKKKIQTPTQIIKLFKNQKDKLEKLNNYITKPEGRPTVAPESDKRLAIKPTEAIDEFAEYLG